MNNLSEKKYKVVTFIVLVAVICAGIASIVLYVSEKIVFRNKLLIVSLAAAAIFGITAFVSRFLMLRFEKFKRLNIVNLVLSSMFFAFPFVIICCIALVYCVAMLHG